MPRPQLTARLLAACILSLAPLGCGYHRLGAATSLPPAVRTLAVPSFTTETQAFHTEFAFTQATIRELNTRTRLHVLSSAAGSPDATLTGAILSQTATPLTYDSSSGQTSSYLITITARVLLTAADGRVLYRNDALTLREQYQSTQDLTNFLQEDSPALQRLARTFAQTLVSNLLESF